VNVGKLEPSLNLLNVRNNRSGHGRKVPKSLMYKGTIKPDLRAMKLLFTLKDRVMTLYSLPSQRN